MALSPRQDRYGITRELKDDYEMGTVLPGAVTIPSHKDNMGSQLGREKRPPIPMVIDPDINGEDAVVITPDKLDANPQMLSEGGDPSEVYRKIVNAASTPNAQPARTESEGRRPIVPRRKKTAAATPAAKKTATVKKEEKPEPAPEPADSGADLSAITATIGRMAEMVEGQGETVNALVSRVNDLTQELDARADVPAQEALPPPPAEVHVEPEARDYRPEPHQAPPVPEAQVPEVQPPTTQVSFQFPGSQMMMSSRYHSVLKDGSNLVLVFDTDFQYGDRMQLAPNLKEPYMLQIMSASGQVTFQGPAMYMGQRFTHGNYEYTLLVLMEIPDGSGS
jgi:hypothetical protein